MIGSTGSREDDLERSWAVWGMMIWLYHPLSGRRECTILLRDLRSLSSQHNNKRIWPED